MSFTHQPFGQIIQYPTKQCKHNICVTNFCLIEYDFSFENTLQIKGTVKEK